MNKLAALSAIALFAAAGPAMAADPIGVPAPAPTPYVPVVDNSSVWDGFYAGINGGYGWGEFDAGAIDSDELEGWLGGAQVGYNWNAGGMIVGVEGDYQFSDIKWDETVGGVDVDAGLNHFGTVRARLGADMGTFMPYVTAGVAFGELGYELDGGEEETEYGVGLAAGAGVEAMVTDNISLRGEYLYVGFSDVEVGAYDVDSDIHTVRAGLNFHF
ncbi:outer membrane beta-barrel protein [Pelagibacterium sp. 26DY04]|uniref:outer membrane protein n=1 Tax=Pelagibacterium sp. 26DY04 TaxID=2967130 RepID=UPI00281566EC|nr:outer membrane beta-barrel protein [Pelagibacterium sp. 26DY04]WMT86685.1 outer membrane beta-barrel protein [Pelagibacterium sp. 26DY04]